MIKLFIVLLNLAFKWGFINETRVIALVQAGMQANQLASTIDRAGNITNFLKTQKRRVFYFLCHKKGVYQENIPFLKTIHIMLILTGMTNGYWHMLFLFDVSVPYPDVFWAYCFLQVIDWIV